MSDDIFKDHIAVYEKVSDHLETLQWKKSGSNTYAMWFVRQYGTLLVFGDCYEAVYQWYWDKDTTLNWMAGCNADYFFGKCRASASGSPYVFNNDEKDRVMKEKFADLCEVEEGEEPCDCESCETLRREADLFDEHGGWDHMQDEHEWAMWLRDNASDVFGDDWWDGSVPECKVLGPCLSLHLRGLKLAMAQVHVKESDENNQR